MCIALSRPCILKPSICIAGRRRNILNKKYRIGRFLRLIFSRNIWVKKNSGAAKSVLLTRNIFRKFFYPKFYSGNISQKSASREIFRAQIFLGQQIFGRQIFGGGASTRGAVGDVQHPAGLKVNRRREGEANKKPATHVPHTT